MAAKSNFCQELPEQNVAYRDSHRQS